MLSEALYIKGDNNGHLPFRLWHKVRDYVGNNVYMSECGLTFSGEHGTYDESYVLRVATSADMCHSNKCRIEEVR